MSSPKRKKCSARSLGLLHGCVNGLQPYRVRPPLVSDRSDLGGLLQTRGLKQTEP